MICGPESRQKYSAVFEIFYESYPERDASIYV